MVVRCVVVEILVLRLFFPANPRWIGWWPWLEKPISIRGLARFLSDQLLCYYSFQYDCFEVSENTVLLVAAYCRNSRTGEI